MSIPEGSPYDDEDVIIIEPKYEGYQLIGDSQLLRFSQLVLDRKRKIWKGFSYLGLCVSGQKTKDLLHRLRNKFHPSSEKMILMIGTNDLLQGTNSVELRAYFQEVVEELMPPSKKVGKLIILTIPPVPRLVKSPEHWKTLKEFNNQIKKYDNGKNVIVIDLYPYFIKNNASCHNSPLMSRNSRSPLVSPSSGIKPLQNSNSTLNIPCLTSNFGKIRTNLRIEVEHFNDRTDRTIYLTGTDSDSSDSDDLGHPSRITTPNKRTITSSGFSTPNPKRKSLGNGSHNISQDDHNDVFYVNDNPEDGEQFETIYKEYFEEYFDKECTRPDLIHLNERGLHLIRRLVTNVIDP